MERGKVHSAQAYAQGKMLDHSGWNSQLSRTITPSDVDMVIDNRGNVMFVELSSRSADWEFISKGQRWLYKSLCREGNISVLARHCVPKELQIRTDRDIIEFSPMFRTQCGVIEVRGPYGAGENGENWIKFVRHFMKNPRSLIQTLASKGRS